MADEFMKGLGLFTLGATGWLIFAGWYRTPGFYTVDQLFAEAPPPENVYDEIAILAVDVFIWMMILGALTFWVLIPAGRELRRSFSDESAN